VPVPSQENERSFICVLVVSILLLFLQFSDYIFRIVLKMWDFFRFPFCVTCNYNMQYQMSLFRGQSGRDRIVVGFIANYAMSITTKVVSSNPGQVRCTGYNIM
jgi:hypothetical protein